MPKRTASRVFLGVLAAGTVGIVLLAIFVDKDKPVATVASAPVATSKPAVSKAGCKNSEASKVLEAITEPSQRAADSNKLILGASTSALTGIARDLQSARRDLVAAKMPSCGEKVRGLFVNALDSEIDGIVLLQAGAKNAASDKFEASTNLMLAGADEINGLVPR